MEVEKESIFSEIEYVIDKADTGDDRHIYPNEIINKQIDCIIIMSWYYRSEIKYNLYKLGYKGCIVDIYECLQKQNINLVVPWYDYPEIVDTGYKFDEEDSDAEFYLIDAFEIYQFEFFYKKLIERGIKARFIAEPKEINISQNGWFDFDTAIGILEEKGLNYSIVCNPNAKFAFTTQTVEILDKYTNKKVRYAYGNGLNKNAMSNSEKVLWGFDYSLVAGEWRKRVLQQYETDTEILCMGYPKYNNYFEKNNIKEDVLFELNILSNKKILVYLPTWGQWSSIYEFSNEIGKLKNDYFIVVKPHHCTSRISSEKEKLHLLYKNADLVLDGNYDFTKVVTIGDLFLCDALSGVATELVYLRPDADVLYLCYKDNALLYEDINQLAEVVDDPKRLISLIRDGITCPIERKSKILDIFGDREKDLVDDVVELIKECI